MKEIFVPYEVRLKLDEIGFDTPCIAYYGAEINTTYPFNFQYKPVLISIIPPSESAIPAPTWEQVFEWFREKGYYGVIDTIYFGNVFFFEIFKIVDNIREKVWATNGCITYEECREALVLKLIEIYKENKFQPKVVQNINNNGAIIGNSINIGNINGNIML